MFGVFQHESMRGAGVEPDIENVVDFLPALVAELAEEALARARLIPGVGAFFFESFDDADVHLGVVENFHHAVRRSL